ncbi:intraflagellar transport protein 88 homolog [Drosophila nasuta]|uniref:intraflagellar transport protein 88 homolog n=1 Tax=Drosophila nasuta TaxID=42062 RepID=UPI00295EC6C0|nr:intraflagellar transport protein 88 homolog [Drosophila nasuta]
MVTTNVFLIYFCHNIEICKKMSAKDSEVRSAANSEMAVATAPPPPPTAAGRPPTSQLFSRGNLVSSRTGGDKPTLARPSTAVRAVGYAASTSGSAGQRFDQFFLEKVKQQTLSSANAAVDAAKEVNPQIKYKNMESKIVKLLESSIVLAARSSLNRANGTVNAEIKSSLAEALNKAKDASSLDRILHHEQDKQGENVFHNFDLTYAVFFNLAEQYEHNDMHIEALNTYNIMTKNKMFPHVNQLKLNMGNIYLKMGMHKKAIKMYRMALDSVPNTLKQLRLKITENIGVLFVRMGQFADAASSFEFIMSERADIRSGIHLLLCYYSMGDVDKIKSTFRSLCDVQPVETERDLENENNIIRLQQQAEQAGQAGGAVAEETHAAEVAIIDGDGNSSFLQVNEPNNSSANAKKNRYVLQALKTDELAVYTKQRRNSEKRSITMIVDLISPLIEENYNDGYNWCIEVIRTSNLSWLANELELNKALVYLRQNDVNQAIETLQMYDRKSESSMTASALTNLSFIYINLGNLEMATHCLNQLQEIGALQTNALALVNASIVDMQNQNFSSARERLQRALAVDPTHFEANYNLGLLALQEQDFALAEEQFELLKAQLMEPHSVQHSHVYYQLAKLQERRLSSSSAGGFKNNASPAALQAYLQVLGISAADIDSRLFEKVGSMYEQIQDHQEANQYYNEAYRINMSDINIASSIGSYYIKLQATEKALYYYERAVLADPNDPNLMLRIASCFRNSYLPPKQYLGMFEKIYARFPDNLTCVRALMQVTKSLGMSELHERYGQDYARLHKQQQERQNEQRYQQQRLSSATSGRGSSRLRTLRPSNEERLPENNDISTNLTANSSTGYNGDQFLQNTNSYSVKQHVDPLGPPAERPRTGMYRAQQSNDSDDDAEMNAESLLPI